MAINTVTIIGRLTKDAKLGKTQKGEGFVQFSIAVNKTVGDEKKAKFFDVSAFAHIADNFAPYLKKGTGVAITGELSQSSWTDKDGVNHSSLSIIARDIAFANTSSKDDINVAVVSGNITKDPSFKENADKSQLLSYTLAVNKGKDMAPNYIKVVSYGKNLDKMLPYLKKGKGVIVSGELSQRTWEKDGKKFTENSVFALRTQFIIPKTKEPEKPAENTDSNAGFDLF